MVLGGEAVELAERLLAGGADGDQKRFLQDAKEFQRKAEAALKEGRDDLAMQMADAAEKTALKAVEQVTYCYDLHATLLHLLGIDHTKLTFRHNGIDRRLTDVHGRVINEILS